jgi:DNA-binding phage protein
MLDKIASMSMILDMIIERIAQAIEESGKTRYQIAKETGIDQAVLCRLTQGGSCSTKTIDLLCEYLGLELTTKKSKKKGRCEL